MALKSELRQWLEQLPQTVMSDYQAQNFELQDKP
jgi:hypothetical protein